MATISKNRTTLVDGCGTILKTNRLEHGYKLVKRKKSKVASAPKKAKVMASASATAPAKRKAGRPKKAMVMASASATAPAKRKAGRPAKIKITEVIKEKVVMTVPSKRRGKRKSVKA